MFGDPEAYRTLRKLAADKKADAALRQASVQALAQKSDPELLPILFTLLTEPALRGSALRGLAAYKDEQTPGKILEHYKSFTASEKADAVNTLASRPEYAMALLAAVAKEQVPRKDVSAFTARQLIGFKDKRLTEKLNAVWGSIRPPAQNQAALLSKYKALLPPDALAKADRSLGRAVFARTCAACHRLFDDGGKIGPELTGAQRSNPEYLLTKLLDPNAVVAKDFQVSVIETVTGRVITGIVTKEEGKTVTIQTPTEVILLPKGDIQERKQTGQSIMPENQLAQLSDVEVRDLIAYLAGAEQVPLPKTPR